MFRMVAGHVAFLWRSGCRMLPSSSQGRPRLVSLLLVTAVQLAKALDEIRGLSASSSSPTITSSNMRSPSQLHPYVPPAWCQGRLTNAPKHRLCLANLPTPLYQVEFPEESSAFSSFFGGAAAIGELGLGMRLLVKRDDATAGVEMGGNKLRKLEFLLADALWRRCDSVVTIGGVQSNHCRATAAASRTLQLEPHLILRTSSASSASSPKSSSSGAPPDLGTVGNLLVDRAVGAAVYTCTAGEYGRFGSQTLVERVGSHLRNEKGKNPYLIPVGGSNGLGSWGYLQGVDELVQQLRGEAVDHVVFASGSGGTAAGIAIGLALVHRSAETAEPEGLRRPSTPPPHVHAVGVCDSPDYFYGQVTKIAVEMGLTLGDGENGEPSPAADVERFVREHLTVHQGKGRGYAVSAPEELEFVATFARETGIVLDPVYTGKALFQFLNFVRTEDPNNYSKKTILFWHTGGALGLYDKVDESFLALLQGGSPCHRLDVYGKGLGIDISDKKL